MPSILPSLVLNAQNRHQRARDADYVRVGAGITGVTGQLLQVVAAAALNATSNGASLALVSGDGGATYGSSGDVSIDAGSASVTYRGDAEVGNNHADLTLTAFAAPFMSATSATGSFGPGSVGNVLRIIDATNAANNGDFLITGWNINTSTLEYSNANGVFPDASSGSITYKEMTPLLLNPGDVSIGATNATSVSVGRGAGVTNIDGNVITIDGVTNIDMSYAGDVALRIEGPNLGTLADIVVQGGVTVSFGSGGNIDLPLNGGLAGVDNFMIGGSNVGDTVTAANLTELTDGTETTLHTHAFVVGSSSGVILENLNTSSVAVGECGYVSGFQAGKTVFLQAIATAEATAASQGVVTSSHATKGKLMTHGMAQVKYEGSAGGDNPNPPVVGMEVYLSEATVGQVTDTVPVTENSVILDVGTIIDITGWASTGDLVTIVLRAPHDGTTI